MTFTEWLNSRAACKGGTDFVASVGGDAQRAWNECENGGHMVWMLEQLAVCLPKGQALKRAKMWLNRARKADIKGYDAGGSGFAGELSACRFIRKAVRWRRVERLLRANGVEL